MLVKDTCSPDTKDTQMQSQPDNGGVQMGSSLNKDNMWLGSGLDKANPQLVLDTDKDTRDQAPLFPRWACNAGYGPGCCVMPAVCKIGAQWAVVLHPQCECTGVSQLLVWFSLVTWAQLSPNPLCCHFSEPRQHLQPIHGLYKQNLRIPLTLPLTHPRIHCDCYLNIS
jgi:hypothetical protein